jgi:acetyltransferase
VLPISPTYAKTMLDETKSSSILKGIRGEAPYDQRALKAVLLMCSELIESYPEIEEMDLNPVIVYEKGVNIADARIILNPDKTNNYYPDKAQG